MKINASAAVLTSLVGLSAIGSITYGLLRPPEPPPTPAIAASPNLVPPASTPTPNLVPPASTPNPVSSSSLTRTVTQCTVSMARVQDPNPPLNVRQAPNVSTAVVGTLTNGTWLRVEAEQAGWFRISDPVVGWVAKQRTESGCNQKTERLTLSGASGDVTIADRFVGTGSHTYRLSLQPGQELTVTRTTGPLPLVTAPDGTLLTSGDRDSQARWSSRATQAGDYVVAQESNFKGFPYAFRLEVR